MVSEKVVGGLQDDVVDGFGEPLARNLWASFGKWKLVGNGDVTNPGRCGCFAGFRGCSRVDLHNIVRLDGESFEGKVFVRLKHKVCYNYRCPTCYLSWAVREAGRIEGKLGVLSKRYGVAEHLSLSVPECMYGEVEKDLDKFLVKVRKALKSRFVFGGGIMFHGFRYADFEESREKGVPFGWRWSPHFHILGFVRKKEFFDVVPKMFLKDGFVVKLMDKRKTVFGTAFYQLNHSSYDVTRKQFHVFRWFGVARTDKVEVPEHVDVCPCCRHELTSLRYLGFDESLKKHLRDCVRGDRVFWSSWLDKDGNLLWHECEDKRGFGSGSSAYF